MRVRLTIDRLVVEGIDLPPFERARMLRTLRRSLEASLSQRVSMDGHEHPTSRHSAREYLSIHLPADFRGTGLGLLLGPALAGGVWSGAAGGAR